MKNIKNILFDIGGVIINLDYELTLKAFTDLGVPPLNKEVYENSLFTKYEMGLISSVDFRKGVCQKYGINPSDIEFDKAWNAMLLDIPPERLQFIQKLSQTHRTFILSNTNEIHKIAFEAQIQEVSPFQSLDEITEKAYYSHEIHDRKPNQSIFQRVLDESNLIPEETLYLEDTLVHIESAEALGIQTIHLQPPLTMLDVLAEII